MMVTLAAPAIDPAALAAINAPFCLGYFLLWFRFRMGEAH
jgi:hypothetical protein